MLRLGSRHPEAVFFGSMKFIPNAMNGDDQFGWFQLSAQVADMRVNGAFEAFKGDAVCSGEKLRA